MTSTHATGARLRAAEVVMDALRAGATLHLQFTSDGPRWFLSNGRGIADYVARAVVASASVVANDDALFPETTPQSWKWWR
jgi:hypothetical protein